MTSAAFCLTSSGAQSRRARGGRRQQSSPAFPPIIQNRLAIPTHCVSEAAAPADLVDGKLASEPRYVPQEPPTLTRQCTSAGVETQHYHAETPEDAKKCSHTFRVPKQDPGHRLTRSVDQKHLPCHDSGSQLRQPPGIAPLHISAERGEQSGLEKSGRPLRFYLRTIDVTHCGVWCSQEGQERTLPAAQVIWQDLLAELSPAPPESFDPPSPTRYFLRTGCGVVPSVAVQGISALLLDSSSSQLKSAAAEANFGARCVPWNTPACVPLYFLEELSTLADTRDFDKDVYESAWKFQQSGQHEAKLTIESIVQWLQQHRLPATSTNITAVLLTHRFYQRGRPGGACGSPSQPIKHRKVSDVRIKSPAKNKPSSSGLQLSLNPDAQATSTAVAFRLDKRLLFGCQVYKFNRELHPDCVNVRPTNESSLRRKDGHLDKRHKHDNLVRDRRKNVSQGSDDAKKWRQTFVGIYHVYQDFMEELNPEADSPLIADPELAKLLRDAQDGYSVLLPDARNGHVEYETRRIRALLAGRATNRTEVSPQAARAHSRVQPVSQAPPEQHLSSPSRPQQSEASDQDLVWSTSKELEQGYNDMLSVSQSCFDAASEYRVAYLHNKLVKLRGLRDRLGSVADLEGFLEDIIKTGVCPPQPETRAEPTVFEQARTRIERAHAAAIKMGEDEGAQYYERLLRALATFHACCGDTRNLNTLIHHLLMLDYPGFDVMSLTGTSETTQTYSWPEPALDAADCGLLFGEVPQPRISDDFPLHLAPILDSAEITATSYDSHSVPQEYENTSPSSYKVAPPWPSTDNSDPGVA